LRKRSSPPESTELLPLAGQTHLLHEPHLLFRYWQRIFGFFEANLRRAGRKKGR
jgi:hypothetical protein